MKDGYKQGIQNLPVKQTGTSYKLSSRTLVYHIKPLFNPQHCENKISISTSGQ